MCIRDRLTKLTYSAYLNILWLGCSLPIVTRGASTTALFYVTLKTVSYTHLDVYKRQVYEGAVAGTEAAKALRK